jgi:uncharacterized OB-fold protein
MAGVRFWREIQSRYNLVGVKCGNCGTIDFPPRPLCLKCHRESLGKMEPYQLSGVGEIVSYTIVHDAPKHLAMQVPYVLAIIKMAEGPSLTGQVLDIDPKDVKIGMKVRAALRRVSEESPSGVIYYGYKFVPLQPL